MVAFCSGQWIWLVRPLRVILTLDFWYSVTFSRIENDSDGIAMKPVSLISAFILLSFFSSNSDRISGSRYPS